MPSVSNLRVEIEFSAGVWTDVTDYVVSDVFINRSRTTPFSPVGPASCEFTLNNADSRFTPRYAASPYYPNVKVRRPVRVSYQTTGPVTQYRFRGEVSSWTLEREGGTWNRVRVLCADAARRLARVEMKPPVLQEVLQDGPVALWPLTDAEGATTAREFTGTWPALAGASPPSFGVNGLGGGDGTAAQFTSGDQLEGRHGAGLATPCTVELFVKINALPTVDSMSLVQLFDAPGASAAGFSLSLGGEVLSRSNVSASLELGRWHHVAAVYRADGAEVLYVNGALVGTGAGTAPNPTVRILVGDTVGTCDATLAYVAMHDHELTADRTASHYDASRGYFGDTTGARVDRFLSYAGITDPADLNTDAGVAIVNTFPQATYGEIGMTVLRACQDMAITEGGGSVFYVAPDGRFRFADRNQRQTNLTPAWTLDASSEDVRLSPWEPSLDDDTLVNDVTVNRATYSGNQTTQQVLDQDSIDDNGRTTDSFDSYATSDADCLANAQDRLSRQRAPQVRLPRVAVDLRIATTNHYATLAALEIGDIVRITNLPAGVTPTTQYDGFAEGWTERVGLGGVSYLVTLDLSPAAIPPNGETVGTARRAEYDTARYQCFGQTLGGAIVGNPPTLTIATGAGLPTFTTNAARYPIEIQVDDEHISIGAPGGAASPQTFPVLARGVNGTPAADHTAGVTVNLAPADTWAL